MNIQAKSVSEIVSKIKITLEGNFRTCLVTGEISNLSSSAAGHWYFTLSDRNSSISCALFKMDALRNPIIRRLKDGDQVIISGPITVYAKRGSFQLLAKKIVTQGKGNLLAQYELLKEKLTSEGLFDLENKKQIPMYPSKVAVITALKGAALQDFLNVIKRRSLWSDVIIVPAVVQGDASAKSLCSALAKAVQLDGVDVIVLTRGGGAIEDLWSFNNEQLVRDIYISEIPIISAVGHQVDYTLCDFVADMRCETPSAAAEILSQGQTKLNQRLNFVGHKLKHLLFEQNANIERKVKKLNPINILHIVNQRIFNSKQALDKLNLASRTDELVPIHEHQMLLDEYINRSQTAVVDKLKKSTHRVEICTTLLSGLNPTNVLKRGYSVLKDERNNIVTNLEKFNKINSSSKLQIQFADGIAHVKKDI